MPSGDELLLGAASDTLFEVSLVMCQNLQFVNPDLGHAALHIVYGTDAASMNAGVACGLEIGGSAISPGRGLQTDGCPNCSFTIPANSAKDYQCVVGIPSATNTTCTGAVGPSSIVHDARRLESAVKSCIDPAIAANLKDPVFQPFP